MESKIEKNPIYGLIEYNDKMWREYTDSAEKRAKETGTHYDFYNDDIHREFAQVHSMLMTQLVNTQPQAEEETKLVMPPSAYEQAEKEGYDMRKKVKSELIPESAPEQKEEGSYVLTYKNLKEIMTLMEEQGLNTVSIEYLMQYCGYPIKNLLLDREREAQIEVLTEIFQTCYQEDSKTLELVEEKLSKLTTK